ncbi:sulfite exporter TauE/SafE family protein [Parahaliea sp. F7430]|uniref:Probable membrane transporter protein n=1 Tax=Sediminihaliea albiluteola TaxID=2758564 RepID=A0A7W2TWU5_9GAMM|nr:sulfite exporter TauE/SafE family protein [Sediminihaliea albiluteola]MBA6413430.1 sulfite exporter TauE/SafE family protein [Sediminihaliea albiluteola]
MAAPDSPLFWLLAITGVLLTGISKSGFAGGAGVVAVPLLSLVMPVQQAAALMLPLLLIMDMKTVRLYWSTVNLREVRDIGLAALLGIALAGTAMASLSSTSLQWILALFCIVFASWQQLTPLLGKLPGAAFIWGTLSGISSTLLHAGGPPISIYFLSKGTSKKVWLAQAAVFFALMNVVKLIPYSMNNVWRLEFFVLDLILLPLAIAGVYLGHKIQAHLNEAVFTLCCRILLGITGTLLLLKILL